MEFIEAEPLPVQCQGCGAQDCEECDCLGLRWLRSEEDQQRLDRIIAEKQRLWKQSWKRVWIIDC